MTASPYSWLLLVAIAASLFTWSRLARRDERLVLIYALALVSGFLGAKIVYLFAEGWLDWPLPDRWARLATGKSVIGALLGGYVGVEIAKKLLGYTAPTGDLFALVAPLGIGIGRIGCLLHGCCMGRVCEPAWYAMHDARGVARWPAVPVELAFNALALVGFLLLRRLGSDFTTKSTKSTKHAKDEYSQTSCSSRSSRPSWLKCSQRGQHFHLYLIAYGLFRFAHEFLRATPLLGGGLSGYQYAALACVALGAWGYARRRRASRVTTKSAKGAKEDTRATF